MIKYRPLRNVSYKFRYYEEACRNKHRIEYLEDRKVKLENLVANNGLDSLSFVDKDGTVKNITMNDLNKEIKSINNSLRKLRRRK